METFQMFNNSEHATNKTNGTTPSEVLRLQDSRIIFWCFLGLETLFMLLGNGMLCWLFITRRYLRSQQNYFVLSLSISDFLIGMTVIPCEYCAYLHMSQPSPECVLFCGNVLSFNMLASTVNLVLIAADRYYSIMHPFRYQEILSKQRVKVIIIISWFSTLIFTLISFSWTINKSVSKEMEEKINLVYMKTLFAFVIFVGILLGLAYYQIVKTIKRKLRDVNEKSTNPAGIKVCILVAISFFICWIPYSFVELWLATSRTPLPKTVMDMAYFIFLLNPCLDPMMYAYYRRDFREELAKWRQLRWTNMKKIYNQILSKTSKDRNSNMEELDNNTNNNKLHSEQRGDTTTTTTTRLLENKEV